MARCGRLVLHVADVSMPRPTRSDIAWTVDAPSEAASELERALVLPSEDAAASK